MVYTSWERMGEWAHTMAISNGPTLTVYPAICSVVLAPGILLGFTFDSFFGEAVSWVSL